MVVLVECRVGVRVCSRVASPARRLRCTAGSWSQAWSMHRWMVACCAQAVPVREMSQETTRAHPTTHDPRLFVVDG